MADAENKNTKKSAIAEREEKTLQFWREQKIFEKSLVKASAKGQFVFYDGPPFATGAPHYGHILAGTMKDVIPRYKTMQGYYVPRRWGWDCHGLPVENLVEKELGLKSKKDIEEYGIEQFNDVARASVLRYDHVWKEIVPRTGRFVDMDNAYLTMDWTYSESIWWSFKTLWDKNLVYQAFKPMHLCPHCETTLSNFEVTQGYKDITDLSVYVKFELEDGTYVLVWTTTPWTLPGNVALAVNPDIKYSLVQAPKGKYILSSEKVAKLFTSEVVKVLKEFLGKELVGKKFKPLFPYYEHADIKNKENGWKIVAADFVTTTDGTGVVHIAPGYGEDDYNLSVKEHVPFVQHVGVDGTFKKEVTDFAGMSVKPKSDDEKTRLAADIAIIKYLQEHGNFFAKEKITHSYPHCWRCDTPLLNYAASSWFVKVTDFKDRLVEENKKIMWVPPEIGQGRFGKWLEGAKDWAISRSRFWGAPLPVWICKDCGKKDVIGSVADLKKRTKRNTYIMVRHGEADSNVKNILNAMFDAPNHLTENGKKQIERTAQDLKGKTIDFIISSDFVRAKETAAILAKELGVNEDRILFDERLREYGVGDYEGKPVEAWHEYWHKRSWGNPDETVPGGESPSDVKARVFDVLQEIDEMHEGKTIVIISHEDPVRYMQAVAAGMDIQKVTKDDWHVLSIGNGEVRELDFAQIPRNGNLALDLHRPYIDEISWKCPCGGEFRRIPEVFDTWYESGSMPYSQIHYPFENKHLIDDATFFPADFIAEGQDQTRGWFYSLLVLSTALFGQSPYENVIVNGIVVAEDGQKMSKRLKNYPEVTYVLDTYGADAMRYYMLSSPVVKAEDLAFSEKGLDEVVKKIIMRLDNVYAFYATYRAPERPFDTAQVNNVLDRWILARLAELAAEVTRALDAYELDRATRPFMNFIDDLSTWYLRRSRDRFKGSASAKASSDKDDDPPAGGDKQSALSTTRFVLLELSKLMAPFMPFLAEDLYQKVKSADATESVHLESWPQPMTADQKILESMKRTRDIVSRGLEARAKAGIKIRQPLNSLTARVSGAYIDLIKDELNVKDVKDGDVEGVVVLDTNITPELKAEGQAREFIRSVQELRKKEKLNPSDQVELVVETDGAGKKLIEAFRTDIMKTTQLAELSFKATTAEEVTIDDLSFKLKINK